MNLVSIKKEDQNNRNKTIFTLIMGLLLSTQICHAKISYAKNTINSTNGSSTQTEPKLTPDELVNIRVYRATNRAVVNVTSITTSEDPFLNITPKPGSGSGTIIDTKGYIVTNNHVIDGASNVKVTLYDGSNLPATVVGRDIASDLAIIKINPPENLQLTTIPFGDSAKLEVGCRVYAIGNPFGLERTLTQGIVSSVGRTLKTENGRLIKGIIQTDAAINPGNSGGPLLNSSGQLVGINTAILSRSGQSAGIGFAIPINIAKHIIPELIAHRHIIRPDVGIQMVQVADKGLRVIKLEENGPAQKAGVSGPKLAIYQQGPFTIRSVDNTTADIILSIDNIKTTTVDDLMSYIESKKAGQIVTLSILREGHIVKIPVKLTVSNQD